MEIYNNGMMIGKVTKSLSWYFCNRLIKSI
jgi:hypothetical protein